MKKLIKKGAAKAATKKAEKKEQRTTAASVVLGMFRLANCPSDEAIITAVRDSVPGTKFDKSQLAWYKHQYRTGRWDEGDTQVINQKKEVKAEAKGKAKTKKTVKHAVRKSTDVEETVEA